MSGHAGHKSSEKALSLSLRQLALAMLGIGFVVMMTAIDQTVVGTALPTIAAELNGFEFYAWVATANLLTAVITIPIFGRLGDYYGRKPFIVVAIVLFIGSSVLCGTASTMLSLVISRALQGIAGGMMMSTAFTSVADLFPDPHARLRWQVLISGAYGVASGIGPTLGGFLTEYAGWRSIFFVNVPVGVIGLFMVWRYLPHIRQIQGKTIRLDWQGALLIASGLGSLQLLIQMLPGRGLNGVTAGLACLTVLSFAALVWWEKRSPDPLLPLELFRNRSLAALFWLSLFTGFVMFALMFYGPLLFQGGLGVSAEMAGLLITPLVFFLTVGSVLNGRIVMKLRNPSVMLYVGFFCLGIASVGVALTGSETGYLFIVGYMLLGGLGLGFVIPNLTVFAQEAASRSQLGIATALLQSLRMIGGMLGLAMVGSLVNHFYVSGIRETLMDQTGAWTASLEDPQIAVSAAIRDGFLKQMSALGLDGPFFIQGARESLLSAIHIGQITVLIVVIIGMVWVHRLPPITFRRVPSASKPESDHA